MKDGQRTRINVNKLRPGLMVAEDIYTPKGLMIIPKNTLLDEKHIFRIKLYQIISVLIMESTNEEDSDLNDQTIAEDVVIAVSRNFSQFRDSYNTQHAATESKLNSIADGEPVDQDNLYQVSTNLIDSIRTKSELFNYMYYLKNDDDYTYTHCLNVSILANIFGRWLKLPEDDIKNITLTGMLHDLGKIQIDKEIINKPGKLTAEEFDLMKKHSTFGYQTIKDQDIDDSIKQGVLFHHEKLDGSGYPLGLTDKNIPMYAKIISIVDIYDAMTSKRSYHDKYSPFKVIRMFEEESYGLLDTRLLFVFLENIAHNYLGKEVVLSNGDHAKIVFIHNQSPSRPIVQIKDKMVDLQESPQITIDEIL